MTQSATKQTSVTWLEIVVWALALVALPVTSYLTVHSRPVYFWDLIFCATTVLLMTFVICMKLIYDAFPQMLPEPEIEDMAEFRGIDLNVDISPYLRKPTAKSVPKQKTAGFVYLIGMETGLYKIGLSKNTDGRLSDLSNATPYELTLIHKIECRDCFKIEKFFHEKFAHKRVKGEWFQLDADDIEYFKIFTQA